MKTWNDRGFTAIEVVLLAVTVGAIGIAGYFAYQNSQKSSSNSVATTPTTSSTPLSVMSPTVSPMVSPKVGFAIAEIGIFLPVSGAWRYSYTSGSAELTQNNCSEATITVSASQIPDGGTGEISVRKIGLKYYSLTPGIGDCQTKAAQDSLQAAFQAATPL